MFKGVIKAFLIAHLPTILIIVSVVLGGLWVVDTIQSWGMKSKIEQQQADIIKLRENTALMLDANEKLVTLVERQNEAVAAMVKDDQYHRAAVARILGKYDGLLSDAERKALQRMQESFTGRNACENASIEAEKFFKERK